MLKVISLMGAPGTGKSTLAHGLFYFIRCQFPYIRAEFVSEYAKEMVWRREPFLSQSYISGNQFNRVKILEDKVDLVVNECAILNGLFYRETWDHFGMKDALWGLHDNSDNYIVHTGPLPKQFEEAGRNKGYEESLEIYKEGIALAAGMSSSRDTLLDEFTLASTVLNKIIENGFLDGLIRK